MIALGECAPLFQCISLKINLIQYLQYNFLTTQYNIHYAPFYIRVRKYVNYDNLWTTKKSKLTRIN